MKNQRNAIVWAIVWWFARRWLRSRTARVTGIAGGAGRGRLGAVLGAFALVAVLAAAFVAWRKLAGGDAEGAPAEPAGVADTVSAASA